MFPVDWQDVRVSCLNEPSDCTSSLSVHRVLEIAGALFCPKLLSPTLTLSHSSLSALFLLMPLISLHLFRVYGYY